jgi:hypothetical protein
MLKVVNSMLEEKVVSAEKISVVLFVWALLQLPFPPQKPEKNICFQIKKMIMAMLVFLVAMKFHIVEHQLFINIAISMSQKYILVIDMEYENHI